LTSKKDLDISHGMEMAAINARDIQKGNGVPQAVAVHQVRRETDKPARRVECFWCGGAHYANDCKFKDAVCHACDEKGHLAKTCRSSKGLGENTKFSGSHTSPGRRSRGSSVFL
jgi:hypothetical protein